MQVIVYKCHDRHTDDEIKIYEYSKENLEKVKNKVKQDWDSPNNSHAAEVHYDGWDFEYGWGEDYYSAYKVVDVLPSVV